MEVLWAELFIASVLFFRQRSSTFLVESRPRFKISAAHSGPHLDIGLRHHWVNWRSKAGFESSCLEPVVQEMNLLALMNWSLVWDALAGPGPDWNFKISLINWSPLEMSLPPLRLLSLALSAVIPSCAIAARSSSLLSLLQSTIDAAEETRKIFFQVLSLNFYSALLPDNPLIIVIHSLHERWTQTSPWWAWSELVRPPLPQFELFIHLSQVNEILQVIPVSE